MKYWRREAISVEVLEWKYLLMFLLHFQSLFLANIFVQVFTVRYTLRMYIGYESSHREVIYELWERNFIKRINEYRIAE